MKPTLPDLIFVKNRSISMLYLWKGYVITCLYCIYQEIIFFGWLSIIVGHREFNKHRETAVFELNIWPMPSCSNLIENKQIDQALNMPFSLIFLNRINSIKFGSQRRWPRPNRPSGSARPASQKLKKFNWTKILRGGWVLTCAWAIFKQMPPNIFLWNRN